VYLSKEQKWLYRVEKYLLQLTKDDSRHGNAENLAAVQTVPHWPTYHPVTDKTFTTAT
jgi:hypothetical protein